MAADSVGMDLRVPKHELTAHMRAHADALRKAYARAQRADGKAPASATGPVDVTASQLPYHPFVLAGKYHTYKVGSAFPVPGGAIQDDKRRAAELLLRACTCGAVPCVCGAHDIVGTHARAEEVRARTELRAAARAAAAEQRALTEAAALTTRLQAAGISMTNTAADKARAAETYATQLLHATRWPREEGVFPASDHDRTAIHCIKTGDVAVLAKLLKHADVAVDAAEPASLRTGLMIAVSLANYEAVKLLLEHGADANKLSATGSAPLHCVWDAWQRTKGHHVVQTQRVLPAMQHITRALITAGASVNARTGSGLTPLHFAAMNNHGAIATMLMKAGADASVQDARGRCAADIAREAGHKDVLTVLLNWHRVASYTRVNAIVDEARAKRAANGKTIDAGAASSNSGDVPDLVERWRLYEQWMERRHMQRDTTIDAAILHKRSLPPRYANFAQYNARTKTLAPVDVVQMLADSGDADEARRMRDAAEEQAMERGGGAGSSQYIINGRVMQEYARATARARARAQELEADAGGVSRMLAHSLSRRTSGHVDADDDATSVAAVMDGGDVEAADYRDGDDVAAAAGGSLVNDEAGELATGDPMSAAVLATLRERGVLKGHDAPGLVSATAASAADTRVIELEQEQGAVWGALGMDKLLLMGNRGGYAHVGRATLLQPQGMRHIVATPAAFTPDPATTLPGGLAHSNSATAAARPQSLLMDSSAMSSHRRSRIVGMSSSTPAPAAMHSARHLMVTDADGMVRLRDPREVAAEAAAAEAARDVTEADIRHPLADAKHSESAPDVMLAVVERRAKRLQYQQRVHDEEVRRMPHDEALRAAAVPASTWAHPPAAKTTAERRAALAAQLLKDAPDGAYADKFTHLVDGRIMTRRPAVASPTLRARRALVRLPSGAAAGSEQEQDALQQLMLGKYAPTVPTTAAHGVQH